MHFYYFDDPCRKVHEKANNSVFRAGLEYCAVADPVHKNGAECE